MRNSYQDKLQRKNLLSDSPQAQPSRAHRQTEEDTWGKLPETKDNKPLFEQQEEAAKPATMPQPSLQPDNLLTSETDKLDGRMQQLHEKYRDKLVRRNLLAPATPTPPAQKTKTLSFKDVYNSEYDDKGNLVYKGTDLHEGGYSNRKEDKGGRTNFGVMQGNLNEYNGWKHPYRTNYNMPKNVEDLTHEQAKTVLRENTYLRYGIDKISDKKLARQMFDQTVNPGPGATIPTFQREINKLKNTNLPGTDIVGKQTQAALNTMSEEELRELRQRMAKNRLEYYFQKVKEDPTQKANLNGWLVRGCSYLDKEEDCEPYRQKAKQMLNK